MFTDADNTTDVYGWNTSTTKELVEKVNSKNSLIEDASQITFHSLGKATKYYIDEDFGGYKEYFYHEPAYDNKLYPIYSTVVYVNEENKNDIKMNIPKMKYYIFTSYTDATTYQTEYFDKEGKPTKAITDVNYDENGGGKVLMTFSLNAKVYDISYDLAGNYDIDDEHNVVKNPNKATVSYPTGNTSLEYFPLKTPTRNGFSFVGWTVYNFAQKEILSSDKLISYINNDFFQKEEINNGKLDEEKQTIKLGAIWKPKKILVSFENLPEGQTLDTIETDYMNVAKLPSVSKVGYDLKNWNTKKDGTGKSFIEKIPQYTYFDNEKEEVVNGETVYKATLYAQYQPKKVTINYFDEDKKTRIATEEKDYSFDGVKLNTSLEAIVDNKDDKDFSYWKVMNEGVTGSTYEDGQIVAGNLYMLNTEEDETQVNVYATYDEKYYTISYKANGGKVTPTDSESKYLYRDGTNLARPTRTGYDFVGWCQKADLSDTPITQIPARTMRGNKTFYAKWKAQTFTYTINENGGEKLKTANGSYTQRKITVTYGQKIYFPEIVRDGCYLKGYSILKGSAYDTKNLLTDGSVCNIVGNQDIRAEWSDTIKVILNAEGGSCSVSSLDVCYNQTLNASMKSLPTPTRKGYTFIGWYTQDGEKITIYSKITNDANRYWYAFWSKNSDKQDNPIVIKAKTTPKGKVKNDTIDNIKFSSASGLKGWFKAKQTGLAYQMLNNKQKKIYALLWNTYKGGNHIDESVSFKIKATENEVSNIAFSGSRAFISDHPELNWVTYFNMSYYQSSKGIYSVNLMPVAKYSVNKVKSVYTALKNNPKKAINFFKKAKISKKDKTFQKIAKIEKLVVKTLRYAPDSARKNGFYSNIYRDAGYIFMKDKKHTAVCVGYSDMMQLLCNYYGIKCSGIVGKVGNGSHKWNMVKADNKKFYYVDATFDDTSVYKINGKLIYRYDYFMFGKNKKDRVASEKINNKLVTDYYKLCKSQYSYKIKKSGVTYQIKKRSDYFNHKIKAIKNKGKAKKKIKIGKTSYKVKK